MGLGPLSRPDSELLQVVRAAVRGPLIGSAPSQPTPCSEPADAQASAAKREADIRRAERERCYAILSHDAVAGRETEAFRLALFTDISAELAISALRAGPIAMPNDRAARQADAGADHRATDASVVDADAFWSATVDALNGQLRGRAA